MRARWLVLPFVGIVGLGVGLGAGSARGMRRAEAASNGLRVAQRQAGSAQPAASPAAAPSPAGTAPAHTPEPSAAGGTQPPSDLADPARIGAGREQFKVTCAVAYCHGPEGRIGGGAPWLRGRHIGTPEQIYNTISNGRRRMPAWKSAFPPEKIWTLVAYVMSLEKEPQK